MLELLSLSREMMNGSQSWQILSPQQMDGGCPSKIKTFFLMWEHYLNNCMMRLSKMAI